MKHFRGQRGESREHVSVLYYVQVLDKHLLSFGEFVTFIFYVMETVLSALVYTQIEGTYESFLAYKLLNVYAPVKRKFFIRVNVLLGIFI